MSSNVPCTALPDRTHARGPTGPANVHVASDT